MSTWCAFEYSAPAGLPADSRHVFSPERRRHSAEFIWGCVRRAGRAHNAPRHGTVASARGRRRCATTWRSEHLSAAGGRARAPPVRSAAPGAGAICLTDVAACPQLTSGTGSDEHIAVHITGKVRRATGFASVQSVRGRRISPPSFFTPRGPRLRRRIHLLYTIAVLLLVAWALGFVGLYSIGPLLHPLLAVAIVLFLVGLIGGRRGMA